MPEEITDSQVMFTNKHQPSLLAKEDEENLRVRPIPTNKENEEELAEKKEASDLYYETDCNKWYV